MPIRSASRYRLQRYLRCKYVNEEAEKAALANWAVHQKDGTAGKQLTEYCRAGTPRSLWVCVSYLILTGLYLLILLRYDNRESAGVFGALTAGVTVGVNLALSPLLRLLRHPHAERAALWLAYLGSADALQPLLGTLARSPHTKAQQRWIGQAEAALTDLLDGLDNKVPWQEAHSGLCQFILRFYRKPGTGARHDVSESRAALLVAALRYLSGASDKATLMPVLKRIIACPASERVQPNRFLVRELACVYLDVATVPCVPPAPVPSVTRSEPSLANLRALLTRRF